MTWILTCSQISTYKFVGLQKEKWKITFQDWTLVPGNFELKMFIESLYYLIAIVTAGQVYGIY